MYTECLSVYLDGKLSFSEKNTWFVGVHVCMYVGVCMCMCICMSTCAMCIYACACVHVGMFALAERGRKPTFVSTCGVLGILYTLFLKFLQK